MFLPRCNLIFLLILLLLTPMQACTDVESGDTRQDITIKTLPELREIKPQRPVKIKLKRNTKGSYSWELNGDDVDRIIQADRRLKESLGYKSEH